MGFHEPTASAFLLLICHFKSSGQAAVLLPPHITFQILKTVSCDAVPILYASVLQREGKQAPQRVIKMSILLRGLVMSSQLPNGWIVSEWVDESKAHTPISVRLVESVLPALHSQNTRGKPSFWTRKQSRQKASRNRLRGQWRVKGSMCTT